MAQQDNIQYYFKELKEKRIYSKKYKEVDVAINFL